LASGPGYAKSPDHTVSVENAEGRWQASANGQVFADTNDAKIVREAGYPPVVYFPPGDVRLEGLSRSASSSYCPFKGQASYYSLNGNDVAWVYEEPYEEVSEIRGHIAFYTQFISVEETT